MFIRMNLSIIIPCKNEENNIIKTIKNLEKYLLNYKFEILIIDDFSSDSTAKKVKAVAKYKKFIKYYFNNTKGLGGAINLGIDKSKGNFICIFMADQSDDPKDLIRYLKKINNSKNDAIFGSRFKKKSKVLNYPFFKYCLNRIFNSLIQVLFLTSYNDTTNAFKLYNRKTLLELRPIISENFNIFLEIPLKIISRNYKFSVIPISWRNRKKGFSSFKIKELGSKYLFTLIYVLIEKILLKKKKTTF
jgi:dolichol-phosphate mannosyltransferase